MGNENSLLAATGAALAAANKNAAPPPKLPSEIAKEDKMNNAICAGVTELLFVLLPLFVISIVFAFRGRSHELFFIPEWALAASVVNGQTVTKLVKMTLGISVHKERVTLAIAVLNVFFLVPSLVVLSLILSADKVSLALAVWQTVLFAASASIFFATTFLEGDHD